MKPSNAFTAAEQLLQQASGRITPARLGVLSILLEAKAALTHQEIELIAQEKALEVDRVTLYRALDWLVEQHLAHRIASGDRAWRYNAQMDAPEQHAHFHCQSCHQVFCLESLQPAWLFSLPSGYRLDKVELNLQGQCPRCSTIGAHSASQ